MKLPGQTATWVQCHHGKSTVEPFTHNAQRLMNPHITHPYSNMSASASPSLTYCLLQCLICDLFSWCSLEEEEKQMAQCSAHDSVLESQQPRTSASSCILELKYSLSLT